jgi:GT2 family glycosyltransferase
MQREPRLEPKLPGVSILLLNWNGWRDTIECLESVFRLDYLDFQVIVCDNDSRDGSLEKIAAWARGELLPEMAEDHLQRSHSWPPVAKPITAATLSRAEVDLGARPTDARLVLIQTGGNLGYAGGNNVGIRWAIADGSVGYIWLLNNDTVVDPGALTALVRQAEADPVIGMVGSRILYYDEPERVQAHAGGSVVRWTGLTHHLDGPTPMGDDQIDPDYIMGASLLARTAVAEQVGGLDERYFLYSEEVDWCLRSRLQGWKLAYAPSSQVWHKGGRSVNYGSPLHDYHTVRGMLLLVGRFYPKRLPVAIAYSIFRCLAPKLVRLQYGRMKAVLRAYADLAKGMDAPPDGWANAGREGR